MHQAPVLLIIAYQAFQALEYNGTVKELEKAHIPFVIASNKAGIAIAADNATRVPVKLTIKEINPSHYAGIFLIGGPGALSALDNQDTYTVMKTFAKTGKPFGAICVSPRILAHAGLLTGKKATGWDGDLALEKLFKQYQIRYIKKNVVTDDIIVTGNGPSAAPEFGKAIISLLKK